MKTNKMKILVALLLCQVLLFFVSRGDKVGKVFDKTKNLVSVDFSLVDRFSLAVSEKESLDFVKDETSWYLPSYFNFPADKNKIDSLFSNLKELKQSWPVGKTLLSAKQFSVTPEKFDKRFDFYQGEKLLGTLYVGSSPSFKKVHMRLDGELNTYEATFSSFDYQEKAESWLNKSLYKTEKKDLAALEIGKLKFEASEQEENFTLFDLKNTETLNLGKVNQAVNLSLNPNFRSVLGDENFKTGDQIFSYELSLKSGVKKTFSFFNQLKDSAKKKEDKEKDDQNLVMKVSGFSFSFEVAKTEIQELLDLKREGLVELKDLSANSPSTN